MGVVGEVADLIDAEEAGARVVAQASVRPRAVSWLLRSSRRSAAVMKSAEWPCRIAWCTVFLAIIVLPSPGRATSTNSPRARKSRLRTRSTSRPMDRLRPVPLEIGDRLEAAEARVLKRRSRRRRARSSSSAVARCSSSATGVHRFFAARASTSLRSVGGAREAEAPELTTQGRRDRVG